jgi:hypothetical protein
MKTIKIWVAMLIAGAALQGCTSVPVVAGGESGAPSFLILADNRLLTSLTVACEETGGSWRTLWVITGESNVTAIEYGEIPKGMETVVAATPIDSGTALCSVEVHTKGKRGKTVVSKSLWILDPYVRSCRPRQRCRELIIDSVTDAQTPGPSAPIA